ncbi:L-lysine 6-monooxygenase [Micromonospora rosaria]|uniref:L-lysine N6-monooxygenase MbtG n=1 Tax=Micromonospora rosaria TaxID=47874 RepID=A0A136PVR7_9ACTN|nr:SidA/IucD/PvdA family monooxygenase [Micromonospora rosaria]KXK62463.1 L-lysine 6-monooxygenase [Micromonospora rosaria]
MNSFLDPPAGPVLDVLGVGFGPSNLALAIALRAHNERLPAPQRLSVGFVERQERFGWHRGMLLDGATLQVSFLKDLATLRDPTSPFTFLAYLQAKGRLPSFINQKALYPSRIEFHDYLEWAAAAFTDVVRYGWDVVGVRPVLADGRVVHLDVLTVRDGTTRVLRTRNLVLACGLVPTLPPGVTRSDRIWHSQELLHRAGLLDDGAPLTMTVVGAGQSAAEVTEYLHRRFPAATVRSVFSRFGYSPADDSPFVNSIFDPAAVDVFYHSPPTVRRMLLGYHANTNYSAVDADLITELYRRVYEESVSGRQRLHVMNTSRLHAVEDGADTVRLAVEHLPTGEIRWFTSDVVVYATGYRPADPVPLLGEFVRYCRLADDGALRCERDYRVVTTSDVECGVYLQGGTQETHGISSSLLSNTAVRAGEITRSIAAGSRDVVPAAVMTP